MAEQIVKVRQGGTGITTAAAHGVVIGNGASAMNVTGAGTAGQVLTSNGASADPTFQSTFIGKTISKSKAADETVTTSTTLQDDDDFTVSIAANETWDVIMNCQCVFGAGNGKIAFTVPSGCTATMSGTISSAGFASATATTAKAIAVTLTTSSYFIIMATFTNGANAGNIQFQFAQNSSDGAATTFKKDSKLIAIRRA